MIEQQKQVAEMMTIFHQTTQGLPKMIEDPKERFLAANLVYEEAKEFARALGFVPTMDEVTGDTFLYADPSLEPDLVEAADAVGDVLVVILGGANRLGVNSQDVFNEVDRSNKTKIWPDGTIHKRESDGKVIKPETYSPAAIDHILNTQEPLPFATV